jgi:hypothetical protein
MKLNTTLSAALFAAIAALSMGAQAATEADKATEAKAPAATTPASAKMKPHSHVELKTGVPQKEPEAKADKPNAAKDQSKHYHPRDAKT